MIPFVIFNSEDNVVGEVFPGELIMDFLDFDETDLFFKGNFIAEYDSEDRTTEIFDEICNTFNRGIRSYTLPKK